ncbi:peptidase inhibitor family I36 protein [Streptomyces sp. NPDC002851]
MTTRHRRHTRLARLTAMAAAAVAAAMLPLSAGTAHAAALPPGVIQLHDGEPCPPATLCLYRDYGNQGPAYGIGAGYDVNLNDLPMGGGNGYTAANNVSSWVNNTESPALLIDDDGQTVRPLHPHQWLQEPPPYNDSVDLVVWPS